MVLTVVLSAITGCSPSFSARSPQPYSKMPGRTMSIYVSGYDATPPELAQWRMTNRCPRFASTASMTLRNSASCFSV